MEGIWTRRFNYILNSLFRSKWKSVFLIWICMAILTKWFGFARFPLAKKYANSFLSANKCNTPRLHSRHSTPELVCPKFLFPYISDRIFHRFQNEFVWGSRIITEFPHNVFKSGNFPRIFGISPEFDLMFSKTFHNFPTFMSFSPKIIFLP